MDEILERLRVLEIKVAKLENSLTPSIRQQSRDQTLTQAVRKILALTQVSTLYLQQTLAIGKRESIRLFDELESIGVVKTIEINADDPTHPYKIGKVSKYKAKKFLAGR